HLEPGRDLFHMVAVAHPDRAFPFQEKGFKQGAGLTCSKEIGVPELSLPCRDNLPAEVAAHELHPVADPEHRNPEFEKLLGYPWSTLFVDRLGSSGQDDAARTKRPDRRNLQIKGVKLAVDMSFPHPPCNQLGVLGAEIENQYFFTVYVGHLFFLEAYKGAGIFRPGKAVEG